MYIRHGSIWEFSHQATRDLVTAATLAYEDKDLDAQLNAKGNGRMCRRMLGEIRLA